MCFLPTETEGEQEHIDRCMTMQLIAMSSQRQGGRNQYKK
jgi:hypothetical protein